MAKTEKVSSYKYRRKGKLVKVPGFKRRPKPKRSTGIHKGFVIRYADKKGDVFAKHQRYIDSQGRLISRKKH